MEIVPNMKEFLKQHDLVYEAAPLKWNCGIPFANGDIGALVWGDGNPLKITLDKYDTWELRTTTPKNSFFDYASLKKLIEEKCFEEARRIFSTKMFQPKDFYPTRLPLPRVELNFTEHIDDFIARLSLFQAVASGSLKSKKGIIDWRTFICSDKNLMLIEFQYKGDLRLKEVKVRLDHLDDHAKKTLREWGYKDPVYGSDKRNKWLKEVFPEGGGYAVVWRRVKWDSSRETIFISVLSFNDSLNPVESACRLIEEAVEMGVEQLMESHEKFWKDFWSKSFIVIPDSKLENLFYVELYKLACVSMGKYPCSLQGLWSPDGVLPPWSGDYHLDVNVEETYWPIYTSNHLELGQPLYEQFWKTLPRFKKMCFDFFGFEGAWSRCQMALDGTPIYGYYTTNFWPGNGAWLAHMYWLHWLYSQDKTFLKERAYPIMKAFLQTYTNLLEFWSDGYYHLPLSNSPEWGEDAPESWGKDTTCDLALIRWLTSSLLEAIGILGIEDSDALRWQEIFKKLAEYPQDESGLQIFRGQSLTHSHRHHSHLMPIHPLGILNIEGNGVDRSLIYRSIRTWNLKGTGEWDGWSFPWASLIAARVRLPNMAWHMLQTYFYFIKPNTFNVISDYRRFGVSARTYKLTYEPISLEAGFCEAAALMEMLLQSWGGRIRVFPAIPDFWKDAYFHKLRAEGAFLITSKLKDHKVEFVIIESETGGTCKLVNPFKEGRAVVKNLETNEKQILDGEYLEFKATSGGKYMLTSLEKTLKEEELTCIKYEREPSNINWFGVKKTPRF